MTKFEYMEMAIQEAQHAIEHEDVPVGAVICMDGKVIARAHNRRYHDKDATAHAEVIAIRKACAYLNQQFLDGCEIYVTCEPCLMCSGAIIQARIKNLYFGAYDEKAGTAGSVINAFATPYNHIVNVEGGILQEECAQLLSDFFKQKRQEKKGERARKENKIE